MKILAISTLLLSSLSFADAGNLCASNETPLFSCKTKSKTASVCLAKSQSNNVRYIFGTKSKVELEYPAPSTSAKEAFRWSRLESPGTSTILSFAINEYKYFVYSAQGNYYSSPDAPDSIKAWSKNGIAISKNGSLMKNIKCLNSSTEMSFPDEIKEVEEKGIEPLPEEDIEILFKSGVL
jgi:hypothetical protein